MSNLFSFSGRINRASFWWSQLALFGMGFVLGFIGVMAVLKGSMAVAIATLVLLAPAILWASFAVLARRLHDLGHSGWLSLLSLVPVIGWGVLLYAGFAPGQKVDNSYGPVPVSA